MLIKSSLLLLIWEFLEYQELREIVENFSSKRRERGEENSICSDLDLVDTIQPTLETFSNSSSRLLFSLFASPRRLEALLSSRAPFARDSRSFNLVRMNREWKCLIGEGKDEKLRGLVYANWRQRARSRDLLIEEEGRERKKKKRKKERSIEWLAI